MILVSPLVTTFSDENKKEVFSCHSTDSHLRKEGEQKQRYKEIITFEFENRGLRLTTSSIWGVGGHLVVEFEHGVRGREKLARNPKGCPPA